MSRKLIAALMLSLAVAGCGKESKLEPRSVAYFLEHPEERKEVIRRANETPDKYRDDPELMNALAAKHKAYYGGEVRRKEPAKINPQLDKLH